MAQDVAEQNKGIAYALTSQALWGTGGIVIKLIDRSLPGTVLVVLRHFIGSLVLGVAIIKNKNRNLKNLPWKHLILLGILASIPDLILIEAVRRAGAIIAVMILRLEIPLAVIFAHFLLRERISRQAYFAAMVSLAGAIFISAKPGQVFNLESSFFVGVVMALAGAVLWALSGVYAKFLLNQKTDALGLTFAKLVTASLFMLLVSLLFVSNGWQAIANLDPEDWLLIFYQGALLSGLAYLMYYKSMSLIPAHISAILLSVSMAVLVVLGLLIGEKISSLQWLGIALVTLSVYMVRPKQRPIDEVS